MSLDKVLHKIQGQIHELAPMLEPFVEETIQPSVNDCESLQKQLTLLQENLAVYKYQKQNKELSPSFNIHAKVSAQEKTEERITPPVVEQKKAEPVPELKPAVESKPVAEPVVETKPAAEVKPMETPPVEKPVEKPVEHKTAETEKPRSTFNIGINDKFRFINTLFSQNASEYHIAVEQLSNTRNWHEAEIYLNSLKNLYDWKENNEVVKHFYSLVKKRFE